MVSYKYLFKLKLTLYGNYLPFLQVYSLYARLSMPKFCQANTK